MSTGEENNNILPFYDSCDPEIDSSLFFARIMRNSTMAAIFVLDMEGIILDLSTGVRTSFGYMKNELLGKNFSMLFTPRDRKSKLPEIELTTVLQKGSANDENYVLHKDGSYIWSKGESVLAYGPGGEIYIVKILYEINQKKLMEKHLIAVQEVYEGVLDTFPDPVVVLDTALKITDANRAFCQLFGFASLDDLYGQPFFRVGNRMWDIASLKSVVKRAASKELEIDDFILEHRFNGIGKKTLNMIIHPVLVSAREKRVCIVMKEM